MLRYVDILEDTRTEALFRNDGELALCFTDKRVSREACDGHMALLLIETVVNQWGPMDRGASIKANLLRGKPPNNVDRC